MQWRVPELNRFIADLMAEHLASPFKTVRSRLGRSVCISSQQVSQLSLFVLHISAVILYQRLSVPVSFLGR